MDKLPLKGNTLIVKAKANSPKTEIISIDNDVVRLAVHAPAEDNKANIEIIKFFSKLTKKTVKIRMGLTSKTKLLVFD